MSKPKGGRGKQAPYESTHVRVPVPIKAKVDKLVEDYRVLVFDGKRPEEEIYNVPSAMSLTTLGEAQAIARQILSQKKSAKMSLQKLLTALYDGEVNL